MCLGAIAKKYDAGDVVSYFSSMNVERLQRSLYDTPPGYHEINVLSFNIYDSAALIGNISDIALEVSLY